MRQIVFFIMIVLGLFINECFADQVTQQIPIYTDSNQTVTVTPSSPEFIIQLKANPTTGYTWTTKQYDQSLLTLISYRFIPPSMQMPGAGGIAEWDFKATEKVFLKPQSTHIDLLYARSWDLSDNPSNVEFKVISKLK